MVDSGFTPNGEASGYYMVTSTGAGHGGYVWTNNGSGDYGIATATGFSEVTMGGTTNAQYITSCYGNLASSGLATVNFGDGNGPVAVTGAVVTEAGNTFSTPPTTNWGITYKLKAGGYKTVYSTGGVNMVDGNTMACGDTNNDGKLDLYAYMTIDQWGDSGLSHMADVQGDGTFIDTGDQLSTLDYNYKYGSAQLIDTGTKFVGSNNDQWALLLFLPTGSGGSTQEVDIEFLDSNGNFIGTPTAIASGMTLAGYRINDADKAYFVPLGTAASVPEPATMLLVGSGVLGLAGVLRRKLMS